MRPDPRTSVHSSGRETDVPIRDPVSTADSTPRSHANQEKSCGGCSNTRRMAVVATHEEWEDRGVGQKILRTVGELMNWIETTTKEGVH